MCEPFWGFWGPTCDCLHVVEAFWKRCAGGFCIISIVHLQAQCAELQRNYRHGPSYPLKQNQNYKRTQKASEPPNKLTLFDRRHCEPPQPWPVNCVISAGTARAGAHGARSDPNLKQECITTVGVIRISIQYHFITCNAVLLMMCANV